MGHINASSPDYEEINELQQLLVNLKNKEINFMYWKGNEDTEISNLPMTDEECNEAINLIVIRLQELLDFQDLGFNEIIIKMNKSIDE
jgi:hypothetical protein